MKRLLVIAALVCFPALAQAQAAPDPDRLFSEGVALMGEEKYDEALAKLQQAETLDPGIGTQFNIGVCFEKLGKLATAYRNFATVQQLAHASGKTAREESARAKVEELRPRLSTVAITLTETTETTVKVDAIIVPRSDWAGYPVDPGTHALEALAPARIPFRTSFAAPEPGEHVDVTVPVLVSSKEIVTVTHETTNTRRAVGLALGGLGVAGLVVASVTGVILVGDHAVAQRNCRPQCLNNDGTYDQHAADSVDQGKSLLPINLVAWAVAAVGLGSGGYLFFTSTKHSAGATVAGAF